MSHTGIYLGFILAAFIAANFPWLNERFLAVFKRSKSAGLRWLEWLILYLLMGLISIALEYKLTGVLHQQSWEFYVTTLCLFAVFALPGFIFHYDVKKN